MCLPPSASVSASLPPDSHPSWAGRQQRQQLRGRHGSRTRCSAAAIACVQPASWHPSFAGRADAAAAAMCSGWREQREWRACVGKGAAVECCTEHDKQLRANEGGIQLFVFAEESVCNIAAVVAVMAVAGAAWCGCERFSPGGLASMRPGLQGPAAPPPQLTGSEQTPCPNAATTATAVIRHTRTIVVLTAFLPSPNPPSHPACAAGSPACVSITPA